MPAIAWRPPTAARRPGAEGMAWTRPCLAATPEKRSAVVHLSSDGG